MDKIAFTVVSMISNVWPEHTVVIVLFSHFRNEFSQGLSSHLLHEIHFTVISNILFFPFIVRNIRSTRKGKQALQLVPCFHFMMKQRLRFLH